MCENDFCDFFGLNSSLEPFKIHMYSSPTCNVDGSNFLRFVRPSTCDALALGWRASLSVITRFTLTAIARVATALTKQARRDDSRQTWGAVEAREGAF